jgi:hypothetical protein
MARAQPPVKALRAPSGRGDSFRSPLSVLVALNDSKLGHGAGIFCEGRRRRDRCPNFLLGSLDRA